MGMSRPRATGSCSATGACRGVKSPVSQPPANAASNSAARPSATVRPLRKYKADRPRIATNVLFHRMTARETIWQRRRRPTRRRGSSPGAAAGAGESLQMGHVVDAGKADRAAGVDDDLRQRGVGQADAAPAAHGFAQQPGDEQAQRAAVAYHKNSVVGVAGG